MMQTSNNSRAKMIIEAYKKHTAKKVMVVVVLAVATVVMTVLCINAGSSGMSFVEVIKALFRAGDSTNVMIVWNIRLPRVIAAILAGAGLALSGCVMQNVLRNPMASPSTLGVSNAAVFGANFAIIVLGAGMFHSTHGETLTLNNPYVVTICAFVCAIGAVAIILGLTKKKNFTSEAVVLSGVALGSLFTAGTTIMQYFAMDTQVAAAVFWTFGDLGRASYREDLIMLITTGIAAVYFYMKRWDYNVMAGGSEIAKSLGVRVERTKFISLLLASMICAVSVSFLGIIGFVGLIAPQAVKHFTGEDYRYLLPASALAGAGILLLSDTIARTVITKISLPVGAVTSLLGAPVFLLLIFGVNWRKLA